MFLLAYLPFLSITINWDPTLADIGPFTLTWHGLFTALGIIGGVTLSVWLAKKDGIPPEIGQEIALVGVPCGLGHVICWGTGLTRLGDPAGAEIAVPDRLRNAGRLGAGVPYVAIINLTIG